MDRVPQIADTWRELLDQYTGQRLWIRAGATTPDGQLWTCTVVRTAAQFVEVLQYVPEGKHTKAHRRTRYIAYSHIVDIEVPPDSEGTEIG